MTQLNLDRRRTPGRISDAQSGPLVRDVVNLALVRLPPWFQVGQARRVAELKRVSHVLIEHRGQVSGAVSATVLAHAPATDAVARWTQKIAAHVTPETPVATVERLLQDHPASCLPVVTAGGLLVGTVSLQDLALASDADGSPASRAA